MLVRLSPSVQRKIWGGKKLEKLKNIPANPSAIEDVGETWEISIHKDGPSFVNEKALSLSESELPYLVKLIDTSDELSVQVHPGDEYAKKHENSLGKSECWLILDAEAGAGIYLGLKDGVTKESFEAGLKNADRMNEYLNFYEVKAGDFFFVPFGSIHAIGRGITLAEVQQSSGITYRVWDWNRVDSKGNPRELHVKKSLDVINFDPDANSKNHFKARNTLFLKKGLIHLLTHECFSVSIATLEAGEEMIVDLKEGSRKSSLLTLLGEIEINSEHVGSYSPILFQNESKLEIKALTKSSFILLE